MGLANIANRQMPESLAMRAFNHLTQFCDSAATDTAAGTETRPHLLVRNAPRPFIFYDVPGAAIVPHRDSSTRQP